MIGPTEGRDLFETVDAAIEGGVDIVQLRAKEAPDEWLIEAGSYLARRCHERRVLFIINDRPDLVEAIGADGVHIGQDDGTVAEARRLAGPSALVGVSTHAPDQLARAAADGADYAGVGPVHTTPTKPGRAATGYRYVWEASQQAELPWFAIGGIDEQTIDRTLASGAERVAVVRAIAEAEDPAAATARLADAVANRSERSAAEERNAARPRHPAPVCAGRAPRPGGLCRDADRRDRSRKPPAARDRLPAARIPAHHRGADRPGGLCARHGGPRHAGVAAARLALLITQALLAIGALFAFAALVLSPSVANAIGSTIVLAVTGTLFWKLVRVLARAQMPRDLAASQAPTDAPPDGTHPTHTPTP